MKINYLAIFAGIILLFFSCNNNSGNKSQGSICISIGTYTQKDLVPTDSSVGSAASNIYEIYVYNSSTFLSTVIDDTSTPVTLSVDEGTYTIIALAGFGSSSRCVLLGSGTLTEIAVIPDTITNAELSLIPVSHSFTVPESATCLDDFIVSISGNTNNALLQVSINGTTMENRPYIEIGDDATNRYMSCETTGSLWNGNIQCTAPVSPGESIIHFFGSNIMLIDSVYSIESVLKELGQISWNWLHADVNNALLDNETQKTINFEETSTGLSVSVDWE